MAKGRDNITRCWFEQALVLRCSYSVILTSLECHQGTAVMIAASITVFGLRHLGHSVQMFAPFPWKAHHGRDGRKELFYLLLQYSMGTWLQWWVPEIWQTRLIFAFDRYDVCRPLKCGCCFLRPTETSINCLNVLLAIPLYQLPKTVLL